MLFIALALTGWSACSCLTGPFSAHTEEHRELARMTQGEITSYIDYKYSRARLNRYDGCGREAEYTTREDVGLYLSSPTHKNPAYTSRKLTLPEGPLYLELYNAQNKQDHAKYREANARMLMDPDGERLAYQLGNDPWQLVYLTSEALLHAPTGTLEHEPSDWSTVPTLLEHALPLWRAYDSHEGMYREGMRARMLQHIQTLGDDDSLYQVLLAVADVPAGSNEGWVGAAKTLTPELQERLIAALEPRIGAPDAPQYLEAWVQALKSNP